MTKAQKQELRELLEEFDQAAQEWGWQSGQESDLVVASEMQRVKAWREEATIRLYEFLKLEAP